MIALAETVRPSEPSQGYPEKEWNRAKAEYRESVERKVATGELKPRAVRVFYALKLRSDHNYKPVYPSLNIIAKDTGLTVKSIRQAITELVDAKTIKIGQKHSPRGGRPGHIYHFCVTDQTTVTTVSLASVTTVSVATDTTVSLNSVQQNPVQENPVQQQPLPLNTPDSQANRSDIVVVLSEFFSKKEAIAIASWTEIGQYDPQYIREKAALTTSKDRDNPLGFMRRALRDDYKPTIPAAKRRQVAREKKEAQERAERIAELRERDRTEAEKIRAGALLRQLAERERAEIVAEARQILVKEGTTEDNPCYRIRLEAACEALVLGRAS